MEFEQLEMGRNCLTTVIARQDVGDYYDILHPKVIVVSHFEYPPAPPTVADTIPLIARGLRRATAEKAKTKTAATQKKGTVAGGVARTRESGPLGANRAAGTESMATTTTAATRTGATSDSTLKSEKTTNVVRGSNSFDDRKQRPKKGGAGKYEVDIVEGPLLATERLYRILYWMSKGKHIAETNVEMEVRKAILQESEKLPPPPAPKNEAERYAQIGRQYTERNQRLSRFIMTYGRDSLLFRDECYFEDGLIVTVHRYMLTVQEMFAVLGLSGCEHQPQAQRRMEEILAEREDFYSARKVRVDTNGHATLPLLDFTFCKIPDSLHLLQVRPVSGTPHVPRKVQPNVEPQFAQGVFLNQQSDPSRPQKEQRVIIRARNKQGDEEVYEFVESAKSRFGFLQDPKRAVESSLESFAGKLKFVYATTSVRVSGCEMESTEYFVPVLRRLVVNAIMTIRALDLSDNHISILPDFSLLPLQRLQLHQNKISDWSQVENRVCPLPLLQSLTLHGNPIAENEPQYWQKALSRLIRHPNRVVRLRQLDFVSLTLQDYNMAGAFELFETGNPRVLEASRGRNPGTNGI
ncbi:hypothetical protein TCSYLVIO_009788 [Trypanosoma cruzi]|uniref:Leucine-rich repeat-containing protein 51 n=1 Tax=Trypanosoma cruzi Dm28c TaxID=1416333 RepID=V5B895_TRYCR|nr:hypothetical protein TCSYLVIO_009788 [Trypanosoma cruzi]ESS63864.1 hypothetical protein TCDM_08186 [Trypanosoma cruzi Dm28c]KAF8289320.1 hypothetical protein TcBrA4_0000720 [Trypanosoma cruzi]RNF16436.1 hypothetical protein TcG_06196 [Trypanosoma cruzi]